MREVGGAAPPPAGWPEPLVGAVDLMVSSCFWRSASCFWRRVFSAESVRISWWSFGTWMHPPRWTVSTRVFEAAGVGACVITDYWEGIGLFLEPDREILVARNGAEVAEHVRTLTPLRRATPNLHSAPRS